MQFEKSPEQPEKPKTTTVRMTPLEVQWLENAMRLGSHDGPLVAPREGIARKIVRARRAAVAPFLPPGFFDGVPELGRDSSGAKAFTKFMMADIGLLHAEHENFVGEDGVEDHAITLELSDDEISMVYGSAGLAKDIAEEDYSHHFDVYQVTSGIVAAIDAHRAT